ncbi:hypothetical protein AN643_02775 [Candidatus Epulonipiscioides saccharophilum]|nr:hypothetical protein AN643_02775 [Epulopiscium sp. SCG-B10WGA-EpuloB]
MFSTVLVLGLNSEYIRKLRYETFVDMVYNKVLYAKELAKETDGEIIEASKHYVYISDFKIKIPKDVEVYVEGSQGTYLEFCKKTSGVTAGSIKIIHKDNIDDMAKITVTPIIGKVTLYR